MDLSCPVNDDNNVIAFETCLKLSIVAQEKTQAGQERCRSKIAERQ